MRIAVIGSRNLIVTDLERYLPSGTTEIVSGGARGVDSCAREYAQRAGLVFVEILPDYDRYGREAPLVRNREIVNLSDGVVAFWDGHSRGTRMAVEYARSIGVPVRLYMRSGGGAHAPGNHAT